MRTFVNTGPALQHAVTCVDSRKGGDAARAATTRLEPAPQTRLPLVHDALAGAVVLVVDDHEPNVVLLERLLSRAGARRVVGLTDPRSAIDRFRATQPDLVLLDLHMPGVDGLAVLQALRPVVAPG